MVVRNCAYPLLYQYQSDLELAQVLRHGLALARDTGNGLMLVRSICANRWPTERKGWFRLK
jgi:hypothetical protein